MTYAELTEQMNEFFLEVQRTVPYNVPNRESVMCGKYSQYIGVLEGLLKHYVPEDKYPELVASVRDTMKYLR